MEIRKLDKELIKRANSVSFNGNRGTYSEETYNSYVEKILGWDISDTKKQQLLNTLYKKYNDLLYNEASHVSVMVAGPARYDAKKYDRFDRILQLSSELHKWLEELEKQYNKYKDNNTEDVYIIERIYRLNGLKLDITKELEKLALINGKEFKRIYEEFNPSYNWRKNSNIYKLYEMTKEGILKEKSEKVIYEDKNYKLYSKKDRIFIKFAFKPKRQLIFAMKKKGFFWNQYENAWSTYLERYEKNKEWAKNISKLYEQYI